MALQLLEASKIGDLVKVQQLLCENKIDVNQIDDYERTPLIVASENGHIEVVELLLQSSTIDINQADVCGGNPLLVASDHGHDKVVEVLLKRQEIDVNYVGCDKDTSLTLASFRGNLTIVKMLLQHNININHASNDGWTSLITAVFENNINIVKLLLNHSAHPSIHQEQLDVNCVDVFGQTALSLASKIGYTTLVELLLQHPTIKVSTVDWPKIKVRMLYLLYDKTNLIVKTPKEWTCYNKIRSFGAPFKLEFARHSILYNDLTNIIYEFARPSYVQIMEELNLSNLE